MSKGSKTDRVRCFFGFKRNRVVNIRLWSFTRLRHLAVRALPIRWIPPFGKPISLTDLLYDHSFYKANERFMVSLLAYAVARDVWCRANRSVHWTFLLFCIGCETHLYIGVSLLVWIWVLGFWVGSVVHWTVLPLDFAGIPLPLYGVDLFLPPFCVAAAADSRTTVTLLSYFLFIRNTQRPTRWQSKSA